MSDYICHSPYGDTVTVISGPGDPIAYTEQEGGEWFACPAGKGPFPAAVLFEDGSIFDTILYAKQIDGGWRKRAADKPKLRLRVKMGRAVQ